MDGKPVKLTAGTGFGADYSRLGLPRQGVFRVPHAEPTLLALGPAMHAHEDVMVDPPRLAANGCAMDSRPRTVARTLR